MKFILFLFAFGGFTLQSCTSTRFTTDHDYSYETNFIKIHSFNFVKCESDSLEYCESIQATIKKQMEIRGYKYDPINAEVYIGYSMLPNKVMYKSFKQPAIGRWIKKYDTDEIYKTEKYNFYNGMIMISMMDAKSNILIWRGFALDISKRNKEEINMNYYYNTAVRNIFNEYELFASK